MPRKAGLAGRVQRLIGMCYFAGESWLALAFRCIVAGGDPVVPTGGESAEIDGFYPWDLPSPLTNPTPRAIPDATSNEYGVARDFLARWGTAPAAVSTAPARPRTCQLRCE